MNKMTKTNLLRIISIVLLITFSLLSIFVISKPLTSVETYKKTIESIDDKKATVMGITTAAATASTAIAAVPGDWTSPIAEEIMEVSGILLVVVCALVLEKSLLTVMGYLSCYILVPLGCALLAIFVAFKKENFKSLGIKILIFAVILVLIVPVSFKIGDFIYEINMNVADPIEELSFDYEDETGEESIVDEQIEVETEGEGNWFDKLVNNVTEKVDDVIEETKETFNNAKDKAKALLNRF